MKIEKKELKIKKTIEKKTNKKLNNGEIKQLKIEIYLNDSKIIIIIIEKLEKIEKFIKN